MSVIYVLKLYVCSQGYLQNWFVDHIALDHERGVHSMHHAASGFATGLVAIVDASVPSRSFFFIFIYPDLIA